MKGRKGNSIVMAKALPNWRSGERERERERGSSSITHSVDRAHLELEVSIRASHIFDSLIPRQLDQCHT